MFVIIHDFGHRSNKREIVVERHRRMECDDHKVNQRKEEIKIQEVRMLYYYMCLKKGCI